MKSSGKWFVIIVVAVAVVFASVTWRRYHEENPTGVVGVVERDGDRWMAVVQFEPESVAVVPVGARALLTVRERPNELLSGIVESIAADGTTRIRLKERPPAGEGSAIRATIDSAVVPDMGFE
jgi:hypothetical protein